MARAEQMSPRPATDVLAVCRRKGMGLERAMADHQREIVMSEQSASQVPSLPTQGCLVVHRIHRV